MTVGLVAKIRGWVGGPIEYRVWVCNSLEPCALQAELNRAGTNGWRLGPSDIENGTFIFWREMVA